jgi:predicted nuclease of predicted toxin-antitoxin system
VNFLIDQNLSARIIPATADQFPNSIRVADVGLARATDELVWQYARDQGFAILTKDADFHQMSFLYGHPPKVVWLRVGNASTDTIIALVRARALAIRSFDNDPNASFLALA